jgi:negative regulator of replication initiation
MLVTYRVMDYQDGFTIQYRTFSDTLHKEIVQGAYSLNKPWQFSFRTSDNEVVYAVMTDTIMNSFSKVQILLNGKLYKEKARGANRFMPVVVSGVISNE